MNFSYTGVEVESGKRVSGSMEATDVIALDNILSQRGIELHMFLAGFPLASAGKSALDSKSPNNVGLTQL